VTLSFMFENPIELNTLSQSKSRPNLFFPHLVQLLFVEETS
jgi:hypothetical protein